MAIITLQYDAHDALVNSIIKAALLAGAQKVEQHENAVAAANPTAEQYARLFGKKKNYTDNEIFIYNSMKNLGKILEKDED
jgi:hypothetical protein